MRANCSHYLEALRLDRWPRSVAILPGFMAALVLHSHQQTAAGSIPRMGFLLILAFLLTWIVSTANYIINEIADAPFDAYHPTKKDRPLVKGEISRVILLVIYALMVAVALCLGMVFFSRNFNFSLSALLIAGLLYNVPPVRVKDIPILDSTIESANNPIRFLIGWYVFSVPFAPIALLVSWWAFGNFLMVGKRVAEKKFLTAAESAGYRLSIKRYSLGSLVVFMALNGVIFISMFALFVLQQGWTLFLYSIPFILIYLAMFMRKSLQDPDGAEEPEKLLKNPYFALYTLFLALLFGLAYLLR